MRDVSIRSFEEVTDAAHRTRIRELDPPLMLGPTTRLPPLERRIPVSEGAGLTHRGRVRERNEDAILTDPTGALWAVADGMGGYVHGEIASDIVAEELSHVADTAPVEEELYRRLDAAHRRIGAQAAELHSSAMGATVVVLMVQHAVGYIAWAGDCRAYLLRRGQLRLVTRDHTVVQDLMDRGDVRPETAGRHPEAHVVTRAVGVGPAVEPDFVTVPLVVGDRMLLCSDGLTACVADQDIAAMLNAAATPQSACEALLSATLEAGAPDNVSVIAVFVREG